MVHNILQQAINLAFPAAMAALPPAGNQEMVQCWSNQTWSAHLSLRWFEK